MPIRIGHYFLVTNPETPLHEVDGLMLDTNFVGNFYDWFLSTNPDPRVTRELAPILNIMREKRLVHWQYGALERSWAWQDIRTVNSNNYSKINPHLFRRIGLAIETILFASDKEYRNWISSTRDFSIPFNKVGVSGPVVDKMSKSEASDLVQAISPAWISILLLMKYRSFDLNETPLVDLQELFFRWRADTRATGTPDTSEVVLIGELYFFGGSISGNFYLDNYLSSPLNFEDYNAEKLLKFDQWNPLGKVKVARNISFDLSLLQLQHLFTFGIRQHENEIRRVRPETMAIVTGDKGLAVLSQQFRAIENSHGLPLRSHKHPENSRFLKERSLEELLKLYNFPFRPPEDLPRRDELNRVLESLIDSSFK